MKTKEKRPLPILFFAITVIISIIAISIASLMWTEYKKEQVKDLHYTNSVVKRYYELSFMQWRNTLLTLGDRLLAIEGPSRDSLRLEVVNAAIKNYDELLAFGLAAPSGKVMTFSNSQLSDSLPDLMQSKNSKRSFIKAREADLMSIGESYYFKNVEDWILPLRVPLRDSDGKLLAVNTTAMQYKVLNKELDGFGFDPNYRIHLVNNDFNVNQFYYPLSTDKYESVVGAVSEVYQDTTKSMIDIYSYFSGLNAIDNSQSIIVKSDLDGLNHSLYVSVSKSFLMNRLLGLISVITVIYLFTILLLLLFFRFSQKQQQQYLTVLEESEANLKSIFESTSNIIGLFDKNKRLLEFNKSFAEYTLQTDNMVLRKGMDVMGAMTNKELGNTFISFQDRALKGEKFTEVVEFPLPDCSLYFSLSYNPIYQNDEITGLSMFVQDITELKSYQNQLEQQTDNLESLVKSRTQELEQKNSELVSTLDDLKAAQQKLIQAEKMASLGVLSAGIGHEINNPLNFIKNGASALQNVLVSQKSSNLEAIQPFLKIIDDGVGRANSIVKSLSHFSRSVKTMEEECDLEEIVEHCLTILHSTLKGKVEIEKDFQANCPKIKGNEGKLHQAILNLITNAEQSIADKGVIKIKISHTKDQLEFEITDSGCGISEEHLDKVADPFFTTKDPGVGTGLGLFITFNIIEEHNGRISVKSTLETGTAIKINFSL